MKKRPGFTLIEISVVVIIIGILATVAIASYSGQSEVSYARMVDSVQASLQSTITQAAARQEVAPLDLVRDHSDNIKNAMALNLTEGNTFEALGSGIFRLTFNDVAHHGAKYHVSENGEVILDEATNFTHYGAIDGVIKPR